MYYDLPSADVCLYLRRFAVSAVYVLTVPDRPGAPTYVGTATDIKRAIAEAQRRHRDLQAGVSLAFAGWCDTDNARRIMQRITQRDGRGGGLLPLDAPAAIEQIQAAARAYRIGLADHATTLDRAGAFVGRIADKVEAARTNGAGSGFNRAYKNYRMAAQAAGRRAMSFTMAEARLRDLMAEAAASGGAASPVAIFQRVFGD